MVKTGFFKFWGISVIPEPRQRRPILEAWAEKICAPRKKPLSGGKKYDVDARGIPKSGMED